MVEREVSAKVLEYAAQYPVVTITGPRQSGKTTLCRMLFPDRPYVSLEAPEERAFAMQDPKGFLERFGSGVVIDEVQRVPELLSYIQVFSDQRRKPVDRQQVGNRWQAEVGKNKAGAHAEQ